MRSLSLLLLGACSAEPRPDLADLADRYLNEEVTEAESARLRDRVDGLRGEERAEFVDALVDLQEADPDATRALWEAVYVADDLDVPLRDVAVEVVTPYEPSSMRMVCSTTSFSSSLYGASCASGCVKGSSYDRKSTETIELGGCDYRFKFAATGKSTIDGTTAAYDAWILSYPSILAQVSGSNTYAVLGWGQMVLNGIIVPSSSKLQVH